MQAPARVARCRRSTPAQLTTSAHPVEDPTIEAGYEADLLAGCSSWQRRRVASLTTAIDVHAGRVLSSDRGSDRQFVIIVKGEAAVSVDGATSGRLGPGCGFGVVSLPTACGPRRANVTAATEMTLLVLQRAEFRTLVADLPIVARRVQQATAERLATPASHASGCIAVSS